MSEIEGFRDRLAYLRWRRNAGRVAPETDEELATEWGVGLQWLRKWKRRVQSPEGRREEKAITAALGEATARWLYDGIGTAPDLALWQVWTEGAATALRAPEPPLTTKEITDFVNEELAASRAYDAERAATPPAARAPGGARKAAGGTRGKSRGR